jgi:topoisomerase IV subunit B
MNPDTRRLLPVAIGSIGIEATQSRFTMLMGKGEASSRRAWLEEHGNEADVDV